jgi:hypothetical protein
MVSLAVVSTATVVVEAVVLFYCCVQPAQFGLGSLNFIGTPSLF